MGKPGRDADLAQESLRAQRGGDLRPQDFDRDFAAVLFFFGEVDGGHAAAAQLTLDGVAIGECGGERNGLLAHATPNARSIHSVSSGPSASNPMAIAKMPERTSTTNQRSARSARTGAARCPSSRATFRRLAFQAKSNASPRYATAPNPASSATLPAIRNNVARDAPSRTASTRIHPARTAPAASPTAGSNPRMGSRPNRRLVPRRSGPAGRITC